MDKMSRKRPVMMWLTQRWRRWSLTRKLIVFYLPLFILPSLIGLGLLTQNYNKAIRANAQSYSDTIANLTVDKLEAVIKAFNDVSLHILTSDEVALAMATPVTNEFVKLELQQQLERIVQPIIGGLDSQRISGCVFITEQGAFIIGQDGQAPLNAEDAAHIMEANGAPYWMAVNSGADQNVSAFRIGRVIKNESFRPIGIFYLVISPTVFREVLNSAMAGSNTAFALLGQQFEVNQESESREGSATKSLLINKSLSYNGWTLRAEYALNSVYAAVYRMTIFTAWLALGCLALGLAASYLIRRDVAVPMTKLLANMRRGLRGEKPSSLSKFSGAREIMQLNDTFISVMYEISNLLREIKGSEERKRRAQLKVLQNQLSPHFIYNALNTIRWMALIRKQDHIREMIDALSNLLRYSIRDTDELVALGDEITVMREFVKIQQVRYQNFEFKVLIDENVEHYRMLKFLIQPLLENAIIHGLSNVSHPAVIKLQAQEAHGMLHIQVRDNGNGIDSDRLAEIKHILSNDTGNHIGLLSVKERIEMFYGPPYGMEITSQQGVGTVVDLRLPILEERGMAE